MLRTLYYAGTAGLEVGLDASGLSANLVAGKRLRTSGGYFFSAASALHAGAAIGAEGNFSVRYPVMAAELFGKDDGSQYSDQGSWAGKKDKGVRNRYLGLKFVVDGEVHYGWARLSVTLGHQRQSDYYCRPDHWPGCDYGAGRNVGRVGAGEKIASHLRLLQNPNLLVT
jgi:hypothetical protein